MVEAHAEGRPLAWGSFPAFLLEAGGNDGTPFSNAVYTYSQIICQEMNYTFRMRIRE